MGGKTSKAQGVIIAQNAAGGGENHATVLQEIKQHASNNTYLLGAVCLILIIGGLIILYGAYQRCHGKLIQREIQAHAMRRTFPSIRRETRKQDPTSAV